jgi:hypothetical protein
MTFEISPIENRIINAAKRTAKTQIAHFFALLYISAFPKLKSGSESMDGAQYPGSL